MVRPINREAGHRRGPAAAARAQRGARCDTGAVVLRARNFD